MVYALSLCDELGIGGYTWQFGGDTPVTIL
jgi:hypothetical protein